MKSEVTIVDFGIGNILNVARAFQYIGAEVKLAQKYSELDQAKRVVLPGVGAFMHGMRQLHERGFSEKIKEISTGGVPLLGICLGMQMLLSYSEEHCKTKGLDILPGKVIPVPAYGVDKKPHKIPHIGWNELLYSGGRNDWRRTLLDGVPVNSPVYFIHSFMAVPDDYEARIADCSYDGQLICASVQYKNIMGCQFHPEKSGEVGLQVLKNFLKL